MQIIAGLRLTKAFSSTDHRHTSRQDTTQMCRRRSDTARSLNPSLFTLDSPHVLLSIRAHRRFILLIAGVELASTYHSETKAWSRAHFAGAHARVPSVVLLDEVDVLPPRREASALGD